MSLDGQYDEANIFARIVRGEVPAAKVFENDDTLAFMDAFPQARGHTLVIHKRARARNILDVVPADLQAIMATVQRVTRAVNAALTPNGIIVTQFNGAPAGQTIFHLHFHIIPRWQGVELARHAAAMGDMAELNVLAGEIRAKME
jgi:histidine triad (HIT) family protein